MTPELLQSERPYLTGLAYRMLGSAAEAEDIVQEAFLRATTIDAARSPRALLTTIVTRLCLDELRSARRRREAYSGPWLPEPVLTGDPGPCMAEVGAGPDARVDEAESLSMAFLVLLESLSPHERAVFILREVLELDFDDIAAAVGRTAVSCRQLLHRARAHVAAGRPRFAAADAQRELAGQFLLALSAGDTASLVELLAGEATCTTDHGGKARAARRTVVGADRIARMLVGLARKEAAAGVEARLAWVNGSPALLAFIDGRLDTVLILETTIGDDPYSPRIARLYVHRNPEKIGRGIPDILVSAPPDP
jgi:RNA polymerase sigma-70 factor (ECF subfamily)